MGGLTEARLLRLAVAAVSPLTADPGGTRRAVAAVLDSWAVDPRTHAPPVWPAQLRAVLRRRYWFGHAFTLQPVPRPERPGLLVFLHGHGPNTALNLHVWRDFADRHGLVVACPTFGYGNWEHPGGVEAVRWALDTAGGGYDPARVYLAGISQGGAGVARAAVALPDRFAGLVLLSPTTEPAVIDQLAAVWRGKPVYVAQGGRDHNVRPGPVTAAVETLRAAGAAVTYHLDPAADHFLFLAQREAIQRELGVWLGEEQGERRA